jgi:hypothetical protein
MGAVSPDQVAKKLTDDPSSGYSAPDTGGQVGSILQPSDDPEDETDPSNVAKAAPAQPAINGAAKP